MNYCKWMGNLPEYLTKVPLGGLAIPGSHDSFTSTLDVNQDVAVDEDKWLQLFGNYCCGKEIIHRWSVTQSMGMVEQLNAGIRYLDLRVCKKPDTDQFHFLHGLYGDEVKQSLRNIKYFFKENPDEVAILDMNHFYNMKLADHDQLLGEIVATLGDMLVPVNGYQNNLKSLTLESIRKNQGRIILIYHHPASALNNMWNKDVIHFDYLKTADRRELLRHLDVYYNKKKRPSGYSFCVWQGCLTPNGCTIVKGLCSSLRDVLARSATAAFAEWVKDKKTGEFGINICFVDFVELSDFIPKVIALNK